MKRNNLLEFYPNPRNNGIFYSMSKQQEFVTFFNRIGIISEQDFHSIDFDYLYNSSGFKSMSVLLENIYRGLVIDEDDNFATLFNHKKVTWDYVINKVDEDLINFVIKIRYLDKWNKLLTSYLTEFNPLTPYTMKIIEGKTDTFKSNNNRFSQNNSNENSSSYLDNDRNAFNSTDAPIPTDGQNSHSDDTLTTTGSSNDDYNSSRENNRELTREGNIGNHSAAQLLIEQMNFLRYRIIPEIYSDLDSILTRSKYN